MSELLTINKQDNVILASSSVNRRKILKNAGLKFKVIKPKIDEEECKKNIIYKDNADFTFQLADLKSSSVSQYYKDYYVIGVDQTLSVKLSDREIRLDKPKDLKEAKHQLKLMRGKKVSVINGMSVYFNKKRVFKSTKISDLVMREFSDEFLNRYLEKLGRDLLSIVGAVKIEEQGINMISSIQGDIFTIQGIDVFILLDFFRKKGVIYS